MRTGYGTSWSWQVLANAPAYSSSEPQQADPEDRGNRAVAAPYEPGSVEKVPTAAALVDSGTANPTTKLELPRRLTSGGASIKDAFYPESDPAG